MDTEKGRALARMEALSQQDGHKMAAVQATRALLEPPPDDPRSAAAARASAGLVIVIGAPQPPQIELAAAPDVCGSSPDFRLARKFPARLKFPGCVVWGVAMPSVLVGCTGATFPPAGGRPDGGLTLK
jgi:hypothetical protein